MKYRIELKKTITAKRYLVQGTVAIPTKRSSLIPILMLAAEMEEERGRITASDLHESLLSRLLPVASQNLLNRLSALGFLDPFDSEDGDAYPFLGEFGEKGYVLTDRGREAANQQEIWENQYGTWEVLLVEHPFFPQGIVEIVASKHEKDDGESKEDRKAKLQKSSIRLPDVLEESTEETLELKNGRQRIEQLEPQCIALQNEPLQLSIKIAASGISLMLHRHAEKIIEIPWVDLDPTKVVTEILDIASNGNYDGQRDHIRVKFDPGNLSLEREIEIQTPIFKGEKFERTTIAKVSYFPRSIEDAKAWYDHLIFTKVPEALQTLDAFQEHLKMNAAKFEPDFSIPSMTLHEAVQLGRKLNIPFYERMNFETLNDLRFP